MSFARTAGVSDHLGNARGIDNRFHVIQIMVEVCEQVRTAGCRVDARKRDMSVRTL
jgi:hypothetical protein